MRTGITSDGVDGAVGAAAGPSQLGAPRRVENDTLGLPHVVAVEQSSGAQIGRACFLDGFVGTQPDILGADADACDEPGATGFAAGDASDAGSGLAIVRSVPAVLNWGCGPKVEDPIIDPHAIDVVQDRRDVEEINVVPDRPDYPVNPNPDSGNVDPEIAISLVDDPGQHPGVRTIEPVSPVRRSREMTSRPVFPIKVPTVGLIPEAFPEELAGHVFDGEFRSSHGNSNVSVVPFRRARAPHPASAAGDAPSSSPAISLGDAVQAVVMRLANKRIRLRVAGPGREEDDRDQR